MISYKIVGVHDGGVEVWDGTSRVDLSSHGLGLSTMLLPVETSSKFEVGDVVDIVVVLRERPEKTE